MRATAEFILIFVFIVALMWSIPNQPSLFYVLVAMGTAVIYEIYRNYVKR
jgi:hypothetical protein